MLKERFYHYACLMRLPRPIGILLLLWPTLMALWLAGKGHPSWQLVLIFTLGVIVMRSAGCIINDIADRKYDKYVQRTQNRPLVTGKVSVKEALVLFVGLVLIAFVLVSFTNAFTVQLSLVGLVLASIYPFMKRYTHFPQVVLGAAFGWAIPMAYSAQSQQLPLDCWLLYAATLCWTIAYDTLYAMADKEEDEKIGVKSTAIFFAKKDKVAVALFQCMMLSLFVILGKYLLLGRIFFIGIILAAICMLYQHWLIRDRQPQKCFQAFLNNAWVGLVLFAGTLLASGV